MIGNDATPSQVKKITELNNQIRQEELRAREIYLNLQKQLDQRVNYKTIDDFLIDFKYSLFSDNDGFNEARDLETGDTFYQYDLGGHYFEDDSFLFNWNEAQYFKEHPLSHLNFGYAMHYFLFHSPLTLEEILAIDNVWIEMIVSYQFLTKKEG